MSERMEQQLATFNERIKRIEDPRNTYYRDTNAGINIPKRVSKAVILRKGEAVKPGLSGLLMALVIGVFCVAAARYGRFNLAGIAEAGSSPQVIMLMDFGVAAIIALIIGGLINQKSLRHMMAQTAGIAVMAVAMHNLVWQYPAEFAQVFTQAYVDEVRSVTSPNSIYLGGETFVLPQTLEVAAL